jgi:hypothetical protein
MFETKDLTRIYTVIQDAENTLTCHIVYDLTLFGGIYRIKEAAGLNDYIY